MGMKPRLEILNEMNKKLERLESNQYIILSTLIPKVNPTKSEKKMIEAALRERKSGSEKKLLEVLRK